MSLAGDWAKREIKAAHSYFSCQVPLFQFPLLCDSPFQQEADGYGVPAGCVQGGQL